MPQKSAFLHKKKAFGKKSTHYVNYSTRVCVKSSNFAAHSEKDAVKHCKSTNLKYIIINRRFAGKNKNNMRKQIFTLLTLALLSTGAAWADGDVVSATQTFTSGRSTCTWNPISATVAKGQTAGGDGLYFTAGANKAISTSNSTVQGGSGAISILYVAVPSASSHGSITIVSSSDADRYLDLVTYDAVNNAQGRLACAKAGSTANFTTSDVVNIFGGYFIKLTNSGNYDYKMKTVSVTLTGEAYPALDVVDPVFSLDKTSITTEQTAQIVVGNRSNMDGISFDGDVTFGTPGVVTVDEDGVVTPVAAGTTTINFNTSAVTGVYNASTNNSLTISVREAILVYDAAGLFNQKIGLTKELIGYYDYLAVATDNWSSSQTIDDYTGEFYNMSSSDRQMTIKVTGASSFEVFVKNNTAGRKYAIKVGSADVDSITHGGTNVESSGLFTIADPSITTTITLSGGGKSVYPAYVVFNPAAVITPDHAYVTYVTTKVLDFTDVAGLDAYVATGASGDVISLTEVGAVPANTPLLLHGTASTTYNVPVVASASAPAENLLVAGTGADINSASKYVLSFQDPNYVFAATNEQAATVPEGKAYLDLSGANAPSVIRIVENTTNIMNVNDVENAVKFIENGKLYIKKNGVTYNVVGAVVK